VIRTVIFDLGRVIVPFDFERAWARIEAHGGVSTPEVRERIAAEGLMQDFESGRIGPEAFFRRISGLCGLLVSFEIFREIWSSIFLPETLVSEAFITALKQKYRLVLLSNTNVLHFEMLRANYPLLRHFDALVLSYEVGAMKPSAEIYRRAIEAAGCLPAECFFTDDIAAYVEGARAHGIDAVQFLNPAQLEEALRARGVAWEDGPEEA
jgi:putative hydrolase of the HAD superfamily